MRDSESFIRSPITREIEDAIASCSVLPEGIATFPVSQYIMQSLLLRMTGSQEQKMRAIAWEMATNDERYRRVFMRNTSKYGEYSSYDSKNQVFKDLLGQLVDLGKLPEQMDSSPDSTLSIVSGTAIAGGAPIIENLFENTVVAAWNERSFQEFCTGHSEVFKSEQVMSFAGNNRRPNLLQDQLKEEIYTNLYLQRNRVAHNATSHQQNLPNLNELRDTTDRSRNYFNWFTLLVIIDVIFMELFALYKSSLDESAW